MSRNEILRSETREWVERLAPISKRVRPSLRPAYRRKLYSMRSSVRKKQ